MRLRKPLLIEGRAGVGKTEVAKVMSRMLGTDLIRLQCYKASTPPRALRVNYQKQLLHIQARGGGAQQSRDGRQGARDLLEAFLLPSSAAEAITQTSQAPVLAGLVDESTDVSPLTLVATAAGSSGAEDVRQGDELISFSPEGFRLTRSVVRKVVRGRPASCDGSSWRSSGRCDARAQVRSIRG